MASRQTQSVRIGMTEHIVRRFFDILVILVLTVYVGYLTWKQQDNLIETNIASIEVTPGTIVAATNTGRQ